MKQETLKAIIVGAGHRAISYAKYALKHPNELEIIGVADPSQQRRKSAAKIFHLSKEQCFETAEDLARAPKEADFVINGTMDHQHVSTSLPLLKAGYDLLLENTFRH